jgi:Domain of unknown function (DUF4159)/Aerotolerance regulator N-terminal
MMGLAGLPLAFAEPLVLLGLLSLPVLWWLLRLIPPQPRRIDFPPTRLLFDLTPKEETPRRTPWWLTLLRLTLAALVIIAAAGPLWRPPLETASSKAPLALIIDDGYPAAGTWDARMRTADDLLARAEVDDRGIALIRLSEPTRDISFETAAAARVRVSQMRPQPYAVERADALPALGRFFDATPNVEVVWLSDAVDLGGGADFVAALSRLVGKRQIAVIAGGLPPAHALSAADNTAGALTVKVLRSAGGGAESGTVRGLDLKGLPLGDAPFSFRAQDTETEADLTLPVEIRNDIARLEIGSEHSAGAVQLLDKRWRRRSVGVLTGSTADTAQPLLSANYYLSRALAPFADIRLVDSGSPAQVVNQFLEQRLPMMILADVGNLTEVHDQLAHWVEDGGVLVRFAGPRLAAASEDDLVPVRLRRGGRILGGSLSWEQPQQLGAYTREGPFFDMAVPTDVTVSRQVLAEPDATLSDHTWATLADGTPLVTAEHRGKGLIVLFHVTADTRWSDLPLSGAFVDMLKRVVAQAGTTAATEAGAAGSRQSQGTQEVIPPSHVLDGFGVFVPPPPSARPVPAGFAGRATPEHPPGFYGPPEGLLAVNTTAPSDQLLPLDFSALNARMEEYRVGEPQDLRGPILLTALGLLALDALVVFLLAGGFKQMLRRRPARIAAGIVAAVIAGSAILAPPSARAQTGAEIGWKAALETRLAYIITGNDEVDRISKSGLQGLTTFLAQRTALEAADPLGLDPARDELAFYPLIYWPIVPTAPKPSAEALQHIDAYMKQGGTVLFDTRDAIEAPPGVGGEARGPGMLALRTILSSLDIPELEPVSADHVLTKTFYLLKDFPGRFSTGRLWVEALPAESEDNESNRPARAGDGVSSIIITSNDLAGAWAMRPDGQAMLPLVANEPRQREFAFRAGVNIVMYTLTGNYKADQVHIPALLERLGQ